MTVYLICFGLSISICAPTKGVDLRRGDTKRLCKEGERFLVGGQVVIHRHTLMVDVEDVCIAPIHGWVGRQPLEHAQDRATWDGHGEASSCSYCPVGCLSYHLAQCWPNKSLLCLNLNIVAVVWVGDHRAMTHRRPVPIGLQWRPRGGGGAVGCQARMDCFPLHSSWKRSWRYGAANARLRPCYRGLRAQSSPDHMRTLLIDGVQGFV